MANVISSITPSKSQALQSKTNPSPLSSLGNINWNSIPSFGSFGTTKPAAIPSAPKPPTNSSITSHTTVSKPDGTVTHTQKYGTGNAQTAAVQQEADLKKYFPDLAQNNATAQSIPQGTFSSSSSSNPENIARENLDASVQRQSQGTYQNNGTGLFPAVTTQLANQVAPNQALAKNAQDIANRAGESIENVGRQGARSAAGYLTTGTSPVGEGNAAVLNQSTAAQQQAIAQGANMQLAGNAQGLTAQNQGQSALNQAAQLASPTQVPYSNQYVDPLTGQVIGGDTGGSLQNAVQSVVSRLTSNPPTMTYNDALTALSGYGQGGVNALQQSLPQNFNIASSNTLGTQQGAISAAYDYADKALSNVENLIKEVSPIQNTNIPLVNSVGNYLSTQTGIGSEATRALTGGVQTLRNAYATLLASAKGGTPTDYSGQAVAEIPNQPTPNDIAAIRKNFETLGKARRDIYGNPANAGTSNNQGTITWDSI